MVGVLWHMNPCGLFNAKPCLYIYIYIYIYVVIWKRRICKRRVNCKQIVTNKWIVTLLLNVLLEFIYFHTVKCFQVLLFNISNSTYQVFLFNINNLITAVWFQITILSKWLNSSIWFIDETLIRTTDSSQSGPGNNDSE